MNQSRFAILGMLTLRPMTGYDMKKLADEALSFFWHESYGNLYPRLRQLTQEKLIEVRREARAKGPDAKVYSLTDRGRAAFREWLEETAAPEPVRSKLLLRVFFGTEAGPDVTKRQLPSAQARERERQSILAAVEERLRVERAGEPRLIPWLMTLRRGQLTVEARLRWCEECLGHSRERRFGSRTSRRVGDGGGVGLG